MPSTTPILGLPYPAAGDSVDIPRDVQALAEAVEGHGAFIIGEVRFIAVAAPPSGWLLCDGAAKSRVTYTKLFTAIGVVYGAGDGTTTFNVPDLRGRGAIGAGQGKTNDGLSNLTNRAAGAKVGAETHPLTSAESGVPAHAHPLSPSSQLFNGAMVGPPAFVAGVRGDTGVGVPAGQWGIGNNTAQDAANPHNNMPPTLAIPVYIYAGA